MGKINNKKQEETKKESLSVYVRGVLIGAMYGKRSFSKGGDKEDKYRLTIKPVEDDMMMLRAKAEPFYEDVEEKWLPKWLTTDKEEDLEFLNLSSNFDIKIGQKNEDGSLQDLGYMMEYIEDNGNINGSKVIVLITIKKGAIYPQAILIKELHQQNISDMFAALDDELPF